MSPRELLPTGGHACNPRNRRRSNAFLSRFSLFLTTGGTLSMKFPATVLLGILLLGGCTWVKPTPGGNQVRLASGPTEIVGCMKLGNTTVSLVDKVGYFQRSRQKVEAELSILGRNSAAEMGGDTILPISEVYEGERSFAVYRCGRP
ncbi:MAG TPA: DUF4156 domain-containing protein [Desulfobacteraceae bacterium]|nr:DUF4156 domain-containing protein [Desulfobacteraceae bacterium]